MTQTQTQDESDGPERAPRFEVFPDDAGGWRFRLVAGNGEIVAISSESYTRPSDARRGIRTVKQLAPAAEIHLAAGARR